MGSPCLDLDRPTTAINVMFLPLNTVISLTLRSIKKLTKKEMKDCRSVSIITGVLNCAANASPPVESSPPLPPVWPFYFSFLSNSCQRKKSVVYSFSCNFFFCLLNGSCTQMTLVSNCGSMWIDSWLLSRVGGVWINTNLDQSSSRVLL